MVVSVVAGVLLAAQALNPTFDRANQEYLNGNFAEAVEIYQRLLNEGVDHPAVFFNLGNTYYELGEFGRAIASYERALQVDPAFMRARDNLSRAVAVAPGGMKAPLRPGWEQALLFWDDGLTRGQSRGLFVLMNIVFWAVLTVRLWRAVPYSRVAVGVCAVAVILSGLSVWTKEFPQRTAVTTAERVPIRYGTSETEPVRFELDEGDRVAVESRRGDWIRVRTIDGDRGWGRIEDFVLVGPPYSVDSALGTAVDHG